MSSDSEEKILSIEEIHGYRTPGGDSRDRFSGYRVTTSEQSVLLLIDDDQQCCESYGYFLSEDNLSDFVGAELQDISVTDTLLKTKEVYKDDVAQGVTLFVNLETDRGTLQFVAYNNHNGYYGHPAAVISKTLNVSVEL